MAKKPIIYTSLPECVKLVGFRVRSIKQLENYEWIKNRIKEMVGHNSSFAEEEFMRLCKSFKYHLFRQVYFQINGKGYFLDFFLPDKNIAIEIDGKQHEEPSAKEYDKVRDDAFRSIGIRTIRFKTRELRDTDFYKKYYCPRLKNTGHKIRPKSDKNLQLMLILKTTEIVEGAPPCSTLEIQSTSLPFLQAIHNNKPNLKSKSVSQLMVLCKKRKKKNVCLLPHFVGKTENMKKKERELVYKWERICEHSSRKIVFNLDNMVKDQCEDGQTIEDNLRKRRVSPLPFLCYKLWLSRNSARCYSDVR